MRIFEFMCKYFRHPSKIWIKFVYISSPMLSDKLYLNLLFHHRFNRWINWKNPQTFNEKLQWLKIYNRKPEYTIMVDKVKAKEWVAKCIGSEYVIPTLGVWNNPDEIDFENLPNRFVLKCNHNSGKGMFICKDKEKMDIELIKKNLGKGLKENYFIQNREWPYKDVPRKILAEQYMEDETGLDLKDYKFFCFNGKPTIMLISNERSKGVKFDYFDMDFNHLPFKQGGENYNGIIKKPDTFERMKYLAAILSKDIPQVRVDFYEINGNVYFGEMTFFDSSGLAPFEPDEWDWKLGNMIEL